MNAEEQLHKLKQTPQPTKEEKLKKLMTAIVLTLATLISVLFLVYAFMQKLEADKQVETAKKAQIEAEMQKRLSEKIMGQREEARYQLALLQKELEDCRKSKH